MNSDRSTTPRYPHVRVQLRTAHPLALFSAVRHALRRGGVAPSEVDRFCELAFRDGRPMREVAEHWAVVEVDRS